MKRNNIMNECPEEFEDQLKDFIDDMELRANAIKDMLDISGIDQIANIEEAYNLADKLCDDWTIWLNFRKLFCIDQHTTQYREGEMPTTSNFKKDKDKEIETMLQLLRETYDVIEMAHLTDNTMISDLRGTGFTKSFANRLFGYLQAKDQTFRDTVIKRQNRFRRKNNQK